MGPYISRINKLERSIVKGSLEGLRAVTEDLKLCTGTPPSARRRTSGYLGRTKNVYIDIKIL